MDRARFNGLHAAMASYHAACAACAAAIEARDEAQHQVQKTHVARNDAYKKLESEALLVGMNKDNSDAIITLLDSGHQLEISLP